MCESKNLCILKDNLLGGSSIGMPNKHQGEARNCNAKVTSEAVKSEGEGKDESSVNMIPNLTVSNKGLKISKDSD